MDRTDPPINRILEQAAYITRRSKEAAEEIEPTEGYKRGQIIMYGIDGDLYFIDTQIKLRT